MRPHRAYEFTMLLAMLLGMLLVPARAAYAATITVTMTADDLQHAERYVAQRSPLAPRWRRMSKTHSASVHMAIPQG